MRTWKHKIDINQYLFDESRPEAERAALVIETLEAAKALFPSDLIESILDGMSMAVSAEDWDEFDLYLEEVYDYGDRSRIWMGL